MEKKYTVNFYDALKAVLSDGVFAKGSGFVDGVYMTTDSYGTLILKDACRMHMKLDMPEIVTKSLASQLFYITDIATPQELSGIDINWIKP